MQKIKKYIAILIAFIILICGYAFVFKNLDVELQGLDIKISSDNKTEVLNCWHNKENKYWLFLPAYSNLEECYFDINNDSITIDGIKIKDGMSLDSFELDRTYKLNYKFFGIKITREITFLKSEKLPTVYIDSESGNFDYINGQKTNKESGEISVYGFDGDFQNNVKIKSISGRGNSTWVSFDKKPYTLDFDTKVDFLGMGESDKWLLLANAADTSNIRNQIVFDFASKFDMQYSPLANWVDLYLNGEYVGLYQLCNRNLVNNHLSSSADECFLVSLEKDSVESSNGFSPIVTKTSQHLRVRYSTIEQDKLYDIWQTAENAILSENGIDKSTGKKLEQLIDIDSWSRKYLIEEVFGNIDAGYASQYFYCVASNSNYKIYAGPVWDYDLSMGSTWQTKSPNSIFADREVVKNNVNSTWYYSLCRNSQFINYTYQLYQKEFLPLFEDIFNKNVNAYAKQIRQSFKLNAIRWSIKDCNLNNLKDEIISYMKNRIDFLNSYWFSDVKYHTVCADNALNMNFVYYAVADNTPLKDLETFENVITDSEFLGWYYSDTDEPFNSAKPITEDISVYAKWASPWWARYIEIIIPSFVIFGLFMVLFVIFIKRIRAGG